MSRAITSRSPGKIILSGEHAVVHGAPALAAAVDVFASAEVLWNDSGEIHLHLADRPIRSLPLPSLFQQARALEARHAAFLRGEIPVRDVAPQPEDLLFAAIAGCVPVRGAHIQVHSDIPLGAGMGSSAAVLLALLSALRPNADRATLFDQAWRCEQYQHGRSSGLDVAASLHGGWIFGRSGAFQPLAAPTQFPLGVFFSGRPNSSTGECVSAVAKTHPRSSTIWSEFAAVTEAITAAIQSNNRVALRLHIRENHRLLCAIGVVPDSLRAFVARVEADGGAAKICGAGSIRPGPGGMVWVEADTEPALPRAWQRFALSISPLGTHTSPP